MAAAVDYIIPAVIVGILLFGICSGTDVYAEFVAGVKEGMRTVAEVFPALFTLVFAVGMFRASGAADLLASFLAPAAEMVGIPSQCIPLALLRPFSGSGGISVFEGILRDNGADSISGLISSVMLGSSETTFYTIAVYYSAVGIKKTGYTLPAALSGDILITFLAAAAVSLLLPI